MEHLSEEGEKNLLDFERQRLELEHKRFKLEQNFFRRHAGTIITGLISLSAVLVTVAQIWSAEISKQKELELRVKDHDHQNYKFQVEAEMQRTEFKQHMKENLAIFIAKNSEDFFSESEQNQKRIRDLVAITFPEDIVEELFKRLIVRANAESKSTWEEGLKQVSTGRRKKITIQVFQKGINDQAKVWENLNKYGYRLQFKPALIKTPTNGLWFSKDIPIGDVKLIALSIQKEFSLKFIGQIGEGKSYSRGYVQIGAKAAYASKNSLAETDINSLTEGYFISNRYYDASTNGN